MGVVVAFTGSRYGMSLNQRLNLFTDLGTICLNNEEVTVLHGGCVGADAQFHMMALLLKFSIEVYPGYPKGYPHDTTFRAEIEANKLVTIHKAMPFLRRNKVMVDRADIVIGAPSSNKKKGGTWHTLDYARGKVKEIVILTP